MLASKSDFTTPQLDYYDKIVDHGIRRGDTGRIFAQWRRPVVSKVAPVLPYWAMRSASYHLICTAIEMASKVGALFSIDNFMSCITNVAT
jgi:hypothetical protein